MFDFSALPPHLERSLSASLQNTFTTPTIICSQDQIAANLHTLLQQFEFPGSNVYFPVKVNHTPEVITCLNQLGTNFEIASLGELSILETLKIPGQRIIFSNPVKISSHIQAAYLYGIRDFAFDTETELEKIAVNAPQSSVFARLSISNLGAEWALNDKFGIPQTEVVRLMKKAIDLNLNPNGIAFHVGWNNKNPETYSNAIAIVSELFEELNRNDIHLKFLNIGGGFPAHNCDSYALLEAIAHKIKPQLNAIQKQYDIRIIAEPGSFLLANAATMVCRVVDVIQRENKRWIFLDSGIFQGFQWVMSHISYAIIYPYHIPNETSFQQYIITGPTCDSHDVFAENVRLPDSIKSGDFMLVYPAGAYISSAQHYNGFDYPETFLV